MRERLSGQKGAGSLKFCELRPGDQSLLIHWVHRKWATLPARYNVDWRVLFEEQNAATPKPPFRYQYNLSGIAVLHFMGIDRKPWDALYINMSTGAHGIGYRWLSRSAKALFQQTHWRVCGIRPRR